MKIMFLQKLTGGLLNGLLKPRLNGLFARTPVLAVLLLTAVVAACGSDSNSSDPAAPSSNQPPVSNQAPVFVAVSGSGQFTPANGTTPANYIFADLHIASPVGSSVGNVSATDANNDAISYNISAKFSRSGDKGEDNELFKINSTTGEITLLGVVEFAGEYHVNATATDDQGESTEATIFVNIDDMTPPAFTRTSYNFDLSLSMAIDGAVVGNVSAMDEDGTDFIYSLEGGGDLFEFADADNPDRTRNIILGRPATLSDFAAPSITFRVMATHTAGEISSEPAAITVNLNNDLQFSDDFDADGVIGHYDASPHDATMNVTGSGEPDDSYIINNIYQLQAIAGVDHEGMPLDFSEFTNGGFLYGADAAEQLTKHYMLANDINASATADEEIWPERDGEDSSGERGWTPIAGSDGQSFSGSFSGDGYAINSLTSMLRQGAASKNFGLFGINNGSITAVGLQDAFMIIKALDDTDDTYAKSTTIDNIISGSHFGGLVGLNQEDGIISYSYTTGNVSASIDAIGGLVGLNQGEISYSYSTVTIEGEGDTGGLVGANVGGALLSSYATGSITGGVGIVGRNGTTGGLAGSISGVGAIISTSYATGSVTDGTTPSGSLGGVVAERNQTTGNGVIIESSYWDNVTTRVSSGVGKNRDNISEAGDETGTFSFTTAQLQGCELDATPIAGASPAPTTCNTLFPATHWDDTTDGDITREWIFNAGEYPSLNVYRTSGAGIEFLLSSPAEQECHRNGNPLGRC